MPLTLEYMRELVRNRLDDEDFEDEYLDNALNQAQRDITNGRNFTFLETTATTTLTNGTTTASYPVDLRALLNAKAQAVGIQAYPITEGYLDYSTFQDNYASIPTASTAPVHWTTFANQMLFPAPADKDYTITLSYIRNSSRVDGDTVTTFDIPDEFEELLMLGAYIRIAKREDDYDVSQNELLDYQKQFTELTRVYTRNRGPRRIHLMRIPNRR